MSKFFLLLLFAQRHVCSSTLVSISADEYGILGIGTDGTLYGHPDRTTLVGTYFQNVAVAKEFACVVNDVGRASCIGSGYGAEENRMKVSPQRSQTEYDNVVFKRVYTGETATCAIKEDKSAQCWGTLSRQMHSNRDMRCEDGVDSCLHPEIPSDWQYTEWKMFSMGPNRWFALDEYDFLYGKGWNIRGPNGDAPIGALSTNVNHGEQFPMVTRLSYDNNSQCVSGWHEFGDENTGFEGLSYSGQWRHVETSWSATCAVMQETNCLCCWGASQLLLELPTDCDYSSVHLYTQEVTAGYVDINDYYDATGKACAIRMSNSSAECWRVDKSTDGLPPPNYRWNQLELTETGGVGVTITGEAFVWSTDDGLAFYTQAEGDVLPQIEWSSAATYTKRLVRTIVDEPPAPPPFPPSPPQGTNPLVID